MLNSIQWEAKNTETKYFSIHSLSRNYWGATQLISENIVGWENENDF